MTDYEIDALYKTGIPVSHAAGLWAVYAKGVEDALAGIKPCNGPPVQPDPPQAPSGPIPANDVPFEIVTPVAA